MTNLTDQRAFDIAQIDRTSISQNLPFTTDTAERLLSQHLEKKEVPSKATFMRDRIIFNPSRFRDVLFYRDVAQFLKCDTIPGLFMLYTIDENTEQHMFESYKCLRPMDLPDVHALISVAMTDKHHMLRDAERVINGTGATNKFNITPSVSVSRSNWNHEESVKNTIITHQTNDMEQSITKSDISVISASPYLRKPYPETKVTSYRDQQPLGFPELPMSFTSAVPFPSVQQSMARAERKSFAVSSPNLVTLTKPKTYLREQKPVVLLENNPVKPAVVIQKPTQNRWSKYQPAYRSQQYVVRRNPEQTSARGAGIITTINNAPMVVHEAPPRLQNSPSIVKARQRVLTYSPSPSTGYQRSMDDLVLLRREFVRPASASRSFRAGSYERPTAMVSPFTPSVRQQIASPGRVHYQTKLVEHVADNPAAKPVYLVESPRLQSTYISKQAEPLSSRSPSVTAHLIRPAAQEVVFAHENVPTKKVQRLEYVYRPAPMMKRTKSILLEQENGPTRIQRGSAILSDSPIVTVPSSYLTSQRTNNDNLIQVDPYAHNGPNITDHGSFYMYAERKKHEPS